MASTGAPASLSEQRGLPVISGFGRRFFFTHVAIAIGLGVLGAEAFWRLYVVPRNRRRDEYYRSIGVEFERLVN